MNHLRQIFFGVFALFCFSSLALAKSPATIAQIRTVIKNDFRTPGLEVATNEFIELKADGRVYVTTTYVKNADVYLKTTHPLEYSRADISRLQKSIAQLNPLLDLVEDTASEIVCDGNTEQYTVMIDDVDTILYERNSYMPNRYRKNRSKLEIAVIAVLKDLVSAYHRTLGHQ